MKAIFWFIGEVEDKEWINNEEDGDEKINTALKTEDVLGKFILLVFIFLFVIALMNLLNAIAIDDIQVCTVQLFITNLNFKVLQNTFSHNSCLNFAATETRCNQN